MLTRTQILEMVAEAAVAVESDPSPENVRELGVYLGLWKEEKRRAKELQDGINAMFQATARKRSGYLQILHALDKQSTVIRRAQAG